MTATPNAHEAAIAQLVDVVYRHPRHREIYYGILAHCAEERTVEEAEAYAENHEEYRSALQNAATLVDVLVAEGGLAYREYDAQGEEITEERLRALEEQLAQSWLEAHPDTTAAQLSESAAFQDAVEDARFALVARRALTTTAAGAAVVELLSPLRRIEAYVASRPERSHLYLQVLELCRSPRTLEEVGAAIKDDPALDPSVASDWQRIRPSYILDRLAEAGGLTWQDGWRVTEAGREFLDSRS